MIQMKKLVKILSVVSLMAAAMFNFSEVSAKVNSNVKMGLKKSAGSCCSKKLSNSKKRDRKKKQIMSSKNKEQDKLFYEDIEKRKNKALQDVNLQFEKAKETFNEHIKNNFSENMATLKVVKFFNDPNVVFMMSPSIFKEKTGEDIRNFYISSIRNSQEEIYKSEHKPGTPFYNFIDINSYFDLAYDFLLPDFVRNCSDSTKKLREEFLNKCSSTEGVLTVRLQNENDEQIAYDVAVGVSLEPDSECSDKGLEYVYLDIPLNMFKRRFNSDVIEYALNLARSVAHSEEFYEDYYGKFYEEKRKFYEKLFQDAMADIEEEKKNI
jgi:hypothetical protein